MALMGLVPFWLLAVSASPLPLEDASAAATDRTPTYATKDDRIEGTISAIDGKYDIRVRDRKGYVDRVRLHDGTVIVPTGLRLTVGQSVTVSGTNGGDRFEANEIDTPYDGADVGRFGFYVPSIAYPSYGGFGYGGFGGAYGYWNAAPLLPYGPASWGPYGYVGFGPYGWPYGYSYGGAPYDLRPRDRDDAPRGYHPSMRRSDVQERRSDQLPQVRPGQQMRIIESHPAAAAKPPARNHY